MSATPFDYTPLLLAGLPQPVAKWTGLAKYNFTGGNNDADELPLDGLIAAANAVLTREGRALATYGLNSGPQGYRPLREFLVTKLKRDAGINCIADEILITSGSLQALDLVNGVLLTRGDTVIIEQECYQGSINRLTRLGVNPVGIPLDNEGMRIDALANALHDLKRRGIRAKYIYTIPTVQNPTGTILSEPRRKEMLKLAGEHGVPIFEDDCYADLIWDHKRPAALHAMSQSNNVIHIGSFSKSIAPALRVGYIVAGWDVLSRMLAIKTDAGSGALEQMVLAEFCAPHFADHVPELTRGLRKKLDTLMEALNEQFGTAAEFEEPKGGIFLWVKLPDNVDTMALYQPALKAGVAINPGPEWSVNKAHGKSRMRLCFASPSHDEIRRGIAVLAEICHREFGVPARISNVKRGDRPRRSGTGLTVAFGGECAEPQRIGGSTMTYQSLTPGQMEARTARFNKLQTYQRQNFEAHDIPQGAVEKVTARKVYPVMAPADYQGRSAGAPVKGPRGLIVSIAECEPGNGPGLHRHLNTVENFFCLCGRFEISWGDQGEHKSILEPNDMISVPRGENRKFFNISNEVGRLLVMIVPETDQQIDPITYAPSLGQEIENEYGKKALEGLQSIGFKFEEPVG